MPRDAFVILPLVGTAQVVLEDVPDGMTDEQAYELAAAELWGRYGAKVNSLSNTVEILDLTHVKVVSEGNAPTLEWRVDFEDVS